MLKAKKLVSKIGITFALASAILLGSASFASASVTPVSCTPTESGGHAVTVYDSSTGAYAVFVLE